MIHARRSILVLLLLAACASTSAAQAPTPSAVSAWVAVPSGDTTGASAYVELNNPTMYEIYVVKATADTAATAVEFRGPLAPGGTPAKIAELPIAAFSSTAAAATAPHLRLVGLKRPLAAGDTVELTLTTDTGVVMKIAAPVRTP